ncbi:DL-glycerol-3-phosphatase [Pestalotiopsis sp. IQ-011]
MGSHESNPELWRILTSIEQISPRGWPRYLFPFELEDDYNLEEVTRVLKEGWTSTCRRFPILRSEAVPDPDTKQGGRLKIRELDDQELAAIEPIVVKDLPAPGAFATFAELKAKHFPVAALDENLNFLQGGLIVNWNPYHAVGDGQTFFTWTEVWAEECRRAQGIPITKPAYTPDTILTDRKHVLHPQAPGPGRAGNLEDHPQYKILTDPAKQLEKLLRRDGHVGQVFYFSEESLARLKRDAYPLRPGEDGEVPYISTNDALSVLAWRSVMAAQFPLDRIEGDPVTTCNIAVDGRYRTQPPIDRATCRCGEMLETTDPRGLSALLRRAMAAADGYEGGLTNDMIALVDRLPHVGLLVPGAFLNSRGLCCSQTSWARLQLYGLEWGPLPGRRDPVEPQPGLRHPQRHADHDACAAGRRARGLVRY